MSQDSWCSLELIVGRDGTHGSRCHSNSRHGSSRHGSSRHGSSRHGGSHHGGQSVPVSGFTAVVWASAHLRSGDWQPEQQSSTIWSAVSPSPWRAAPGGGLLPTDRAGRQRRQRAGECARHEQHPSHILSGHGAGGY